MPIIKSAIKRMKQTIKRRERNIGIKRDIKSAVKTFLAEPTSAALSAAHSEIDTAVKKNLIKKNTAARRKAQLAKVAKDAGVSLSSSTKKTASKPAAKPAVKAKTASKPAVAKKTAAKPAAAKKAPAKKPTAKKTAK